MGTSDNKILASKLKGLFGRLMSHKDKPKDSKEDGYTLLLSIIDRKVFDVENDKVKESEFQDLTSWALSEFNKAKVTVLSGRVIKEEPLVIIEVVEDEPVFIEIHDYKVRYRINLYHETQEVDIKVMEPVKEESLGYKVVTTPTYIL